MSSELQSDVWAGGSIWWMLTGWRPSVVDWGGVFASCYSGSNCSLACAVDGFIALQHHWLMPINYHFDDCKAWLDRTLRVSSAV